MSKKARVWDVIWQIVKFVLTLGISHINKRNERRKSEVSLNGTEIDLVNASPSNSTFDPSSSQAFIDTLEAERGHESYQ